MQLRRALLWSLAAHGLLWAALQNPLLQRSESSVSAVAVRSLSASLTRQPVSTPPQPHLAPTQRVAAEHERRLLRSPLPTPTVTSLAAVDAPSPAERLPAPGEHRPYEPYAAPIGHEAVSETKTASQNVVTERNLDADGLRRFRLALAEKMRQFRYYPHNARGENLDGVVELRLIISADGSPPGASVVHSSGHSQLDQAAIAMLTQAAPLTRLPTPLQGKTFAIHLPVLFELE